MRKSTNCKSCLFAHPHDSPQPCDHGIISHIKDTHKLEVVDNYFSISDYQCKMGFSKSVYEENNDDISIEQVKEEILKNACIRYYLVVDLTGCSEDKILNVCNKINELKIPPKYISFLLINESGNKEAMKALEKGKITSSEWKGHGYVIQTEKINATHMAIDTNLRKNNSQLLLFYDPNNIDELDEDINEINTIMNVEQPPFHVLMKRGQEKDKVEGLLLSFSSYIFLKNKDYDLMSGIQDIPDMIILHYGK
jgi:hypothetical protein